ncbi:MAG: hypothetical protein PHT48_06295 [Dechloromonas sp.]|nr:hypothetical protein [Dechloromonas sp.]
MSQKLFPRHFIPLCGLLPLVSAWATSPVKAGDETLNCTAITEQRQQLATTIAAGDPNTPSMGKAAAGTAANVGSSVVTQASGLFGALGGLAGKLAGSTAQQQVEERMAPDAAAQAAAGEARDRDQFLDRLANAKGCLADNPAHAGKALSAEEFKTLTTGPAAGEIQPMTVATVNAALQQPLVPLVSRPMFDGDLQLADKRFYISEFRVLFEVGGEVSARTRAGYMPGGTSYGATNSRIKYKVAQPDIAALQRLTDQAWANLKEQLAARGISVEDAASFTAANGAVYPATEAASTPQAPVYIDENLGHTERKYLVLAPTGMKLHSRGIAGLGAGNIGTRISWVKNKYEGLALSVAIHIAALETTGSGSSILNPDGANTGASPGMTLSTPPGGIVANTHADTRMVRLSKPIAIPGNFARFRTVGGFNTQDNAAVRALQIAGNLAGVAANKSRTVEMEVDLDGPNTSRMAMQGLQAFNQSVVEAIKP